MNVRMKDVGDLAMHFGGGFAVQGVAYALAWAVYGFFVVDMVGLLIVHTSYGLLREQAQRHSSARTFRQNWVWIWSPWKVLEAVMWSLGAVWAAVVGTVVTL